MIEPLLQILHLILERVHRLLSGGVIGEGVGEGAAAAAAVHRVHVEDEGAEVGAVLANVQHGAGVEAGHVTEL